MMKHQAGVLSVEKLTAFKPSAGKLVSVPLTKSKISYTGLKKVMSYALLETRNLGIRLNYWTSVEIDLIEDHPNHQMVDINFMAKGFATHRVLGIKIIKNTPVSFESVSVHALPK